MKIHCLSVSMSEEQFIMLGQSSSTDIALYIVCSYICTYVCYVQHAFVHMYVCIYMYVMSCIYRMVYILYYSQFAVITVQHPH